MITLDELRALDDAAFNRAIAEAAGWRVSRDTDCQKEREQWYWVYHNGAERGYVPGNTPDEAWERGLENGPDNEPIIPRYATDLNAAWGLPIAPNCRRLIAVFGSGDVAIYDELHISAARALATAWYAWRLAQVGDDHA